MDVLTASARSKGLWLTAVVDNHEISESETGEALYYFEET